MRCDLFHPRIRICQAAHYAVHLVEWQPSAKGITPKALGFRMTVFRIEVAANQGMWGYFVGARRGNSTSRTLNGGKVVCRELIDQLKQEER